MDRNASRGEILAYAIVDALNLRGLDVTQRLPPMLGLIKELIAKGGYKDFDVINAIKVTFDRLNEIAEDFPKAPSLIASLIGLILFKINIFNLI